MVTVHNDEGLLAALWLKLVRERPKRLTFRRAFHGVTAATYHDGSASEASSHGKPGHQTVEER